MPIENSVQRLFICYIKVHIFITFLLFSCNFFHFFLFFILSWCYWVLCLLLFLSLQNSGSKLYKIFNSYDWISIVWKVLEATERSPMDDRLPHSLPSLVFPSGSLWHMSTSPVHMLIVKIRVANISVNKLARPNGNVGKYIGGRNVTVGGRYGRF